jgi:hypothetical protein
MAAWRGDVIGVAQREFGAGIAAGVTALVASLLYVPGLWVLAARGPVSRGTELYFFFTTGFTFYAVLLAPVVAFLVATAVWRWTTTSVSSPRRGAIAGVVTALATVLFVPVAFGSFVALQEVLVAAGLSARNYALFASPVQSLAVITWGGLTYWSPLTASILGPLAAAVGWTYQRRRRRAGR